MKSVLCFSKSKLLSEFVSNCVVISSDMPYYAVAKGRRPGIYNTWADCESQVKGFRGAKFKKFDTSREAQQFVTINYDTLPSSNKSKSSFRKPQLSTSTTNRKLMNSLTRQNWRNESESDDDSQNSSYGTPNTSYEIDSNFDDQYNGYYPSTSSEAQNTSYEIETSGDENPNTSNDYQDTSYENQNVSHVYSYGSDSNQNTTFDAQDSDEDIDEHLNKAMDKIEQGIKKVERTVNRIMKKNTGSRPIINNVGANNSKLSNRRSLLMEPPVKKKRTNEKLFEVDEDNYVQVYTDGACSANGKQGARAGIGVYWGQEHPLNVSAPVSGRATNNCGEIQAATKAIEIAVKNGVKNLTINTDSQFLINSVTKWLPGWKRKGWKLGTGEPVKNEKDFKELDKVQKKLNIRWNYVKAHDGVYGNEMADQLAKEGAARYGI